jgi:predicted RNase H-like HicB family nuclease
MWIELERMEGGSWIARVPALPGVAAIGEDRLEAFRRAQAEALRFVADQLEQEQPIPGAPTELSVAFAVC